MAGKLWSKILNPGGGLRYHSRALLYRNSRWRDYRAQLSSWLEEWIPAAQASSMDLLLIAPSAGHCLPSTWLGSFRSVAAIDLDPMASILFRRLHGASMPAAVEWIAGDVFQQWEALLASHPGHVVLFCNFLGQAAECDDVRASEWFAQLPASLEGRRWASFHDRYSGELATKAVAPLDSPHRADPETLLRHFYEKGISGELTEHELPPLFPQVRPYRYWSWPLAPDQFHIIEGCRS
jgi:hypothetical protein